MIKHEIQDKNSIKVYVSYLGDNQLHLTVATPDRDIDPIQACTDAYRAVARWPEPDLDRQIAIVDASRRR